MKKITVLMLVLLAWAASLPAQVTREKADEIVLNYLQNEATLPHSLYVNVNMPNEEGFVVTTFNEETVTAKYACWVYCLAPYCFTCPSFAPNPPGQFRYLFVKENNGSLLEIITSNDYGPNLFSSWEALAVTGLTDQKENNKSLYPNPAGDWLTIPCNGENTRVEIYDLKGTLLFSQLLSGDQLNVSFLSAGIYMVNVNGEIFRLIKK